MLSERLGSWTKELLREGEILGKRVEAASTLRRLLAKRFGPIPTEIELRISAASLDELEAWFDRAIDAQTLGEVFEKPL